MIYNFDEAPVRENTDCLKYDRREEVFGRADVIPMWIADMDFATPPFIIEALRERLNHEILGYSFRPDGYFESFITWVAALHGWEIQREWIEFSPGVVPALNICTHAYTSPGDEIIIQPPVYPPFYGAVSDHGRRLVFNPLIETDKGYLMDLEGLRRVITPKTRMLILSNPHNPVGRVWTRDELSELAEICHEKGIVVLSDEIHSDLTMPGVKHVPLASVSEKAAMMTVTCMAPSKTFNLAGLSTSSMIISDPDLMKQYRATLVGLHLHLGNIFGNVASEAAYTGGREWLDQLMQYVEENVDLVMNFCRDRLPVIRPLRPEATYMIWLDCRAMGMSGTGLNRFFVDHAGVGMNEGSRFGPGGEGFMRMNLACPRATVQKALEQIENAIKKAG
ncbi:MAG: PatB family C-S lyase [Bacteroidales bacterium]|jgi:cystathionine beta-lyase|nr:PatB family C-S lyase [Bacteroidales bacterium]HOO67449.1 PatB family C-S lyase [Bacteroidales bacterium]HPE23393.1 PatB family C-S lyase [Bacteroidales bacterium]HPJ06080.1 PatB family C-S lyase [Bacteroidales bacterium]HPQ64765.1 PatB family C-S lyase [Bacteroidales bacterium]